MYVYFWSYNYLQSKNKLFKTLSGLVINITRDKHSPPSLDRKVLTVLTAENWVH